MRNSDCNNISENCRRRLITEMKEEFEGEREKERDLPDVSFGDGKESVACAADPDARLFWAKTTAIKRFYGGRFAMTPG